MTGGRVVVDNVENEWGLELCWWSRNYHNQPYVSQLTMDSKQNVILRAYMYYGTFTLTRILILTHTYTYTLTNTHTFTCTYACMYIVLSYMTLIGVHEMHGHVTDLLVVDLC